MTFSKEMYRTEKREKSIAGRVAVMNYPLEQILICLFCKDVQFSLNVLGRKKIYEIEISLKSREFSVLNKGVLKRF